MADQNVIYSPFSQWEYGFSTSQGDILIEHWEHSSPRFSGNQICCPVVLVDQPVVIDIISSHPDNVSQSTFQILNLHGTQAYNDDPNWELAGLPPNAILRKCTIVLASFSMFLFIFKFY